MLCKQVCDQLKVTPPLIKRHVKMMQAGVNARLREFVAGPFDVRVGRRTHNMDLYVAPSRTSCCWEWTCHGLVVRVHHLGKSARLISMVYASTGIPATCQVAVRSF